MVDTLRLYSNITKKKKKKVLYWKSEKKLEKTPNRNACTSTIYWFSCQANTMIG